MASNSFAKQWESLKRYKDSSGSRAPLQVNRYQNRQTAFAGTEKIEKEGYLWKRGRGQKSNTYRIQKRYIVLTTNGLYYNNEKVSPILTY